MTPTLQAETLAVIYQKGGVGKTTCTANLAASLAATSMAPHSEEHGSVLVIDLDPQHNCTTLLGVPKSLETIYDALVNSEEVSLESVIQRSAAPGVDVAPGHLSLSGLESALASVMGREMLLAEILEPVKNRYEFILIDTPPSFGIGPAMAITAANLALIPAACKPLSLPGLSQTIATLDQARRRGNPNLRRRILLTMIDERTSHARPLADKIRTEFPGEVYATEIGQAAELERGVNNRASGGAIRTYAPASMPAQWFDQLAREVRGEAVHA